MFVEVHMTMDENSLAKLIEEIEGRILAGGQIERYESELLLSVSDSLLIKLAAAADHLRITFKGNKFTHAPS
jgi:hypothetical protein